VCICPCVPPPLFFYALPNCTARTGSSGLAFSAASSAASMLSKFSSLSSPHCLGACAPDGGGGAGARSACFACVAWKQRGRVIRKRERQTRIRHQCYVLSAI
jgi:hypothetical protein